MRTEVQTPGAASRTGWRGVIVRSGLAMTILLGIAAVSLRDVEAAAFTVGGLVALSLVRFRRGLLGVLGLTLLSADVALWMAPGAFSNLTHGEGFWETALPGLLTVAAATTFIACVGDLRGRRRSAPAGRGPAIVSVMAAGLALVAIVTPVVGIGGATSARASDLRIVTEDVKYLDTTLQTSAGTVGAFVENRDLFWHTFTIRELDVNLSVPVGAQRRVTFEAPPGRYDFVCAIPGHTQAGMKGTLTVR